MLRYNDVPAGVQLNLMQPRSCAQIPAGHNLSVMTTLFIASPHKFLLQFIPFPKQGKRNYKAVPSPLSFGNNDFAIKYASFGVNLI